MDDDFFDDELLALAEGTGDKRKRKDKFSSKSSRSKRAKHDSASDTDDSDESEGSHHEKYPLEGQYKDEEDRDRLLDMTEVDREAILAERMEAKQLDEERKEIRALTHGRNPAAAPAKSSKRQRQGGGTKEKRDKLDELKAKRHARSEKKLKKAAARHDSDSGEDMDTSSDEEEAEAKTRPASRDREPPSRARQQESYDDATITLPDLLRCMATRESIVKHYHTPWFEQWIKGSYVKYLLGTDGSDRRYRICEVTAVVAAKREGGYGLENTTVHHDLELKHGKATKVFGMCEISNSTPTPREFERWKATCLNDHEAMPKKSDLLRTQAQMSNWDNKTLTEEDIQSMVAKRPQKSTNTAIIERSRLLQERSTAERRDDWKQVQAIDVQLQALGGNGPNSPQKSNRHDVDDRLAKVNERNRKANLDAIRRSEMQDAERRRRDRKLALNGANGTATPTAEGLGKLLRKGTQPGTPHSRPGTPLVDLSFGMGGTDVSNDNSKTVESSVIESLDVDLGDF